MTTIRGDKISAVDLDQVVMLNNIKPNFGNKFLSPADLEYREAKKEEGSQIKF